MWDLEFIWSCSRSISRTSGWMRCWGWSPQILKQLLERPPGRMMLRPGFTPMISSQEFLVRQNMLPLTFHWRIWQFFHLKHTWLIMNHNYIIIQKYTGCFFRDFPPLFWFTASKQLATRKLSSKQRHLKGVSKTFLENFLGKWRVSTTWLRFPGSYGWYEQSIQR